MNRNCHKSNEEMRMQLRADFQKQNEATVALLQSQALLEMQKREAGWLEKQKENQV